ncbi:MAG: hypothetical protein KKB74_03980 [Bacteroidetes bacterium]|nr:hypothetical protein [Bacteroidota bacterium]
MNFSFLKKDHKSIPEFINQKLLAVFPRAINIEWNKNQNTFEALFYMDEAELIAKLNEKGELIEHKKNIRKNEIPETIGLKTYEHGEIMSAIAIYFGEEVHYEIIIRQKDLVRYLLILNSQGTLLEKRKV